MPDRTKPIIGAVAAAVLAFAAAAGCSSSTKSSEPPPQTANAAVATLTNLPPATLSAAGGGTDAVLTPVTGRPPLTKDGKPYVLYVGAEFCPYCAAQRWPVIIALSRFGSFAGLAPAHSSPNDVNPSTPTWTFRSASYTSQYLTFDGVETSDVDDKPLQKLTPEQKDLVKTYDAAPYVPENAAGGIPFVDLANQYVVSGSSYDPSVLAGLTQDQIVAQLADPNSKVAKAVLPVANRFTAALCAITDNKNTAVCSDPVIAGLEKH
jgi:thiol-disulfide isomerase/thioredoxin